MHNLIKEAKRYALILKNVQEHFPLVFDDCARGTGIATTNGLYHAIEQAEKDTVTAAAPELLDCEGECSSYGQCDGDVRAVEVSGNGFKAPFYFNYCQAAIKEDQRRGFLVNDLEAKGE